MIRTYTFTLLSIMFLPLALVLIFLGVDAIVSDRKKGIWLKLALAINTSLAMITGFLGSSESPKAEEIMATCYDPVVSDFTKVEKKFEESADWRKLEDNMWYMESHIRSGNFDNDTANKLYLDMKSSIENMRNDGIINGDDAEILIAYVGARHEFYCTNVGSVRCYEKVAIPLGKETTKKEIAETTTALRQLYKDGKLDSEAYETALATLENKLKLYTEKEDNAVLRQLLLDLADGRSGMYFD